MRASVVVILIVLRNVCSLDEVCDLRPLGTKNEPLPADNRFVIEILGISNDLYIPRMEYRVRLYSRDNVTTFIAYTIAAKEDEKLNERNPRKPLRLDTGLVTPTPNGVPHPVCRNAVMQADVTPKTSVEVTWKAPSKENKCVTIYALVAIKPDVWYSLEGPLSQRVCEDERKMEDMPPSLNNDCKVCENARYQVRFEGTWSYNTHQTMFPLAKELARFSELVGASHGDDFTMWKFNSEAGDGLKMLAEQGNTTKLEIKIQENLGDNVRTIIKASSPPKTNMTTTASFRVTPKHHRVSLVCGILPSPDWFLGVAHLELCSVKNNQWTPKIELNLYPMDAGTDSGATFESPNEATLPPKPISGAKISKDTLKEETEPFAKLHFQLIRTYPKPAQSCNEDAATTTERVDGDEGKEGDREVSPPAVDTSSSEEPPQPDPGSPPDCTLTEWENFECAGDCVVDGNLEGVRLRKRYHMVDGLIVGKYTADGLSNIDKEKKIPPQCKDIALENIESCEDACETEKSDDAIQPKAILPGEKWIGTRR